MPIPFDMIAAMLFLGYYAESPVRNPPDVSLSAAVVAALAAGLFAAAAVVNHAALAMLRRYRTASERRHLAGVADLLLRLFLVAVYAAGLVESAFPWSMAEALGLPATGESFSVLVLGLVPYLVFFLAAWTPMYGLHRATSYGSWTRLSFLVHKARYNLYMLIAWLPFALLVDWLSGFLIILPVVFLLAAWAFPFLLARAWGCRPLPAGEVMDTVKRLEGVAGVRFSRIYLWEPGGGGTQNAAAVGLLPPFRYLFLTPALIDNMRGPELEAVVLHELGHVRNRHLIFYLFTSLAGINLAVLLGAIMPLAGPSERFFLTAGLVLLYFRVVFGWLSRNMERQADLFALEKSGSSRGLINALEKLALGAGSIRLAASWHHLGIAQRVDFLRRAERRPELARRHNAGVAAIMRAGYLVSALVIGGMVWFSYVEYLHGVRRPPAPTERERANENEAHWRRVMEIMPDNADARLELAYRLAGDEHSREEAARLAGQALRLSAGGQTGAAARKLIRDLNLPGDGGADGAETPASL